MAGQSCYVPLERHILLHISIYQTFSSCDLELRPCTNISQVIFRAVIAAVLRVVRDSHKLK